MFISNAPAIIESGLPAVYFDTIVDTGLGLETQHPVTIAATVLLSPYGGDATQCEVLVGQQRSVFLRYVNHSSMGLSVPLGGLNSFFTSGDAVPETLFAPGLNGFVTPLDRFFKGGAYTGSWVLLGRTIPLQFPLPVCTDSGAGSDCRVITARDLRKIRVLFASIVEHYNDKADQVLARARGNDDTRERARRWRSEFRERSDKLETAVVQRLRRIQPPVFFCGEPPPQCATKTFPQPVFQILFDRLIGRRPPYPFSELVKMNKRDRRRFRTLLSKYPQVYHRCPVHGS